MISCLLGPMPHSEKQGIFPTEQGVNFEEQGSWPHCDWCCTDRLNSPGESGYDRDTSVCRIVTQADFALSDQSVGNIALRSTKPAAILSVRSRRKHRQK